MSAPSLKTARARELRAASTDAERVLWYWLRKKQMNAVRFRRQQPIGPYIVDFYCAAVKLIVELDGDQHGEPAQRLYDAHRTQWLTRRGYRVVRFANARILTSPMDVLDEIERLTGSALTNGH